MRNEHARLLVAVSTVLIFLSAVGYPWPARGGARYNSAAINSDESPSHTNRLARELSPYLLQHAHNPVDWYPWGEEAFRKANTEDKLIFLSVGYSTCHWCHVMENESFSQPDVAQILNEHFVSIKVDREERPDVDDLYMTVVQLVSRASGWPQTTVLLPDGRPCFGGTYFPKSRLVKILQQLAAAYRNDRARVEKVATRLTEAMREFSAEAGKKEEELTVSDIRRGLLSAVASLRDSYDAKQGGFGSAPKFPPHSSFPLLFSQSSADKQALLMATHTLKTMARGGIRDHVGGGFHRYATDENWKLPHFEKMLYDNALLGQAYTEAYRITGQPEYREVAEGIYDWVLREMADPAGGFYSALDADSGGVEGGYYLWTEKEVLDLLGPENGSLWVRAYNIEEAGNYEDQATGEKTGMNVIYLNKTLDAIALDEGLSPEGFASLMTELRGRLFAARQERKPPLRDDKILAAWNALMIASLARAGATLKQPSYTEAALRAAGFIRQKMICRDGTLLRRWRAGTAGIPGFLEDYAYLCDALIDLYEATADEQWIATARLLADTMLRRFRDSAGGGFFDAEEEELILIRTKNPYDRVLPAGNAVAVRALARLGRLKGEQRYITAAEAATAAFRRAIRRLPEATETLLLAAQDLHKNSTLAGTNETASGSATATPEGPVQVSASPAQRPRVAPGKRVGVVLKINIEPGWHINSHEPLTAELIPTRVTLGHGTVDASLDAVHYPAGQTVALGFSKDPLLVYQGTISLHIDLQLATEAPPGAGEIALRVHFQPCSDSVCLAPETREVLVPLVIGPATPHCS